MKAAADPLSSAESRLTKAREQGVDVRVIERVRDIHLHYEDTWDRFFEGALDPVGLLSTIAEGMALIDRAMAELPQRHCPALKSLKGLYVCLLQQANKGIDLSGYKLEGRGSLVRVPHPFRRVVLGVSSLDELRSLLPPFTAGLNEEHWEAFKTEHERLAVLTRPHTVGEPIASVLGRANEVSLQAGAGSLQWTTEFDWRLQKIVATSRRRVLDCVELFHDATDEPGRFFRPVRVRIIPGLFGMAYFDSLQPGEPCCPDCGRPTTPGRRGPRNVLCPGCRQRRRQLSYRRKRRLP